MKLGVEAGRLAFEAGRMEKKLYASASSSAGGSRRQTMTARVGTARDSVSAVLGQSRAPLPRLRVTIPF